MERESGLFFPNKYLRKLLLEGELGVLVQRLDISSNSE